MDCNKDEAARAKEIAEKKFKMKDIVGAKKFALKAQSLYPELEGIVQMLATLDVYMAAEDVDWYRILNASLCDDNDTLKRKYKKLALLLHPDKNKSIGAEGAFKHVCEAWKFLSDKEKRASYDRRKVSVFQRTVSSSNNGFSNFAKTVFTTNARTTSQMNNPTTQKKNSQKPVGKTQNPIQTDHHSIKPSSFAASGSLDQSNLSSFWTVCRRCLMQYEYQRVYVNCNLMCPQCLQSFSAVEVPKPGMSSHWSSFTHLKRNTDPKSTTSYNFTSGLVNSKWKFSRTSSAAHCASVVQQAYEKIRKEREKTRTTARTEKKNSKRKVTMDSSAFDSCSLKRRKVRGEENDTSYSSGRNITYYLNGETRKNIGKLERGTKDRA